MLVTANIFQPLIDVFESVLKFFHNSGGISWGWSIVLLTVCVRAVLIPLTIRQIRSMVRMQQLAPQMKEIQAKYKDDRERQSQEMMKFYRENNVNPLGSCLPLVLQLPVFVSLYYMLRESLRGDICPAVQTLYQQKYAAAHHISVAAAHGHTTACGTGHSAGFLFIGDLTDKAHGLTLVVLLILYVGTQLFSMVVMSTATMEPTQRYLMMGMPLIFVLFVYRFPAGVLVYWITTNLWTMGQQGVVKRRIGPLQAANAGAGAGGGSGSAATRGRAKPAGPPGGGPGRNGGSQGADGAEAVAPAGVGRWGAMLRERLAPSAETTSAEDASGTGTAAVGDGGRPSGGRRRGSGTGGAGASPRSSRVKSDGGSGGGSGAGGSGGSSRASGAGPPPRPPRKKKKRSGRRR